MKKIFIILTFLFFSLSMFADSNITLELIIQTFSDNNLDLKTKEKKIEEFVKKLEKSNDKKLYGRALEILATCYWVNKKFEKAKNINQKLLSDFSDDSYLTCCAHQTNFYISAAELKTYSKDDLNELEGNANTLISNYIKNDNDVAWSIYNIMYSKFAELGLFYYGINYLDDSRNKFEVLLDNSEKKGVSRKKLLQLLIKLSVKERCIYSEILILQLLAEIKSLKKNVELDHKQKLLKNFIVKKYKSVKVPILMTDDFISDKNASKEEIVKVCQKLLIKELDEWQTLYDKYPKYFPKDVAEILAKPEKTK